MAHLDEEQEAHTPASRHNITKGTLGFADLALDVELLLVYLEGLQRETRLLQGGGELLEVLVTGHVHPHVTRQGFIGVVGE